MIRTQGNTAYDVLTPNPVAAAGASGVIIAKPAMVGRVLVANLNAADTWFFQIFDNPTVPADATSPNFVVVAVPPQTMLTIPLYQNFALGVSWAASSTMDTKTIEATAEFSVQVGIIQ